MSLRDVPASVRARLANQGRATSRPLQELLQFYAIERFLHRLSCSEFGDRFVLKGALMLSVWRLPDARPTRDIDLLGHLDNKFDTVEEAFRAICLTPVDDDGVVFDHGSLRSNRIKEDADYQGVRILLTAYLGNARIPMQIDVGFGDVVVPSPEVVEYPTLLGFQAPRLRGYPKEALIAEKFHAMVQLGLLNSRMKDYYDIRALAQAFQFDGQTLLKSIHGTFSVRGRRLPDTVPVGLTGAFAADPSKRLQWQAFARRLGVPDLDLGAVVADVSEFLVPVVKAAHSGNEFQELWSAGGAWSALRGREG